MQAFDFDSAITMHRAWKMKFHMALDNIRSKDFDTRPLGDEASCRLGQWLAANARELEGYGSTRELLAVHQEFHRQSESIADAIRNGNIVNLADKAIVGFGTLSARIEDLLRQLENEIQQAG